MGRVETMKVDEVVNLLSMHRLLRLKLQWIDIGASAMWRAKRRKKRKKRKVVMQRTKWIAAEYPCLGSNPLKD